MQAGFHPCQKMQPNLIPAIYKKYKPGLMKSHILRELAGPELLVFKCTRCQETFRVSKPARIGDYHCPKCGLMCGVMIDKDATDMLQAMLLPETPKYTIRVKPIVVVKQPKNSDGKV